VKIKEKYNTLSKSNMQNKKKLQNIEAKYIAINSAGTRTECATLQLTGATLC